jgi:valyl-tRNA synthetase
MVFEMITAYQQPIDSVTFAKAIEMLENNLKLSIYAVLDRGNLANIALEQKRSTYRFNLARDEALITALIADFENTMEVISGVRTIRKTRIFRLKMLLS